MKNKTSFILFWVVLIGFINTIVSCTPPDSNKQGPLPPRTFVYLLCDLTSSIDTAVIHNEVGNVRKLLNMLPPNTTYTLNPVGQTPDRAICEGETDPVKFTDETVKKSQKQYSICLRKIYDAYYNRYDSATCILDALQNACVTMKALQQTKIYDKLILVVFSDMLEVCSVNGIKCNLENKKVDTNAANKVITNWPASRQFFKNLDSVRVYTIFNTSKLKSYSWLSDFWGRLFSKAGYKSEALFTTDFRKRIFSKVTPVPTAISWPGFPDTSKKVCNISIFYTFG